MKRENKDAKLDIAVKWINYSEWLNTDLIIVSTIIPYQIILGYAIPRRILIKLQCYCCTFLKMVTLDPPAKNRSKYEEYFSSRHYSKSHTPFIPQIDAIIHSQGQNLLPGTVLSNTELPQVRNDWRFNSTTEYPWWFKSFLKKINCKMANFNLITWRVIPLGIYLL